MLELKSFVECYKLDSNKKAHNNSYKRRKKKSIYQRHCALSHFDSRSPSLRHKHSTYFVYSVIPFYLGASFAGCAALIALRSFLSITVCRPPPENEMTKTNTITHKIRTPRKINKKEKNGQWAN